MDGLNLTPEEIEHINKQISEDTCTEHNTFCCPICFNMEPAE